MGLLWFNGHNYVQWQEDYEKKKHTSSFSFSCSLFLVLFLTTNVLSFFSPAHVNVSMYNHLCVTYTCNTKEEDKIRSSTDTHEETTRGDTSRLSSYCAHRETLMWLAKVSEGSSPWVFGSQLRMFYWIHQWFWDIYHEPKTRYLDPKFWL